MTDTSTGSAATSPAVRARMLYIHALSPIHSGTGQSTEVIDLPVAREKHTGLPYLPGSSVKGVLRDACEGRTADDVFTIAFGPTTDLAHLHAGGLWFTDARLLCLPVRSLAGSFAWITCPLALHRWLRDYDAGGERPDLTIPEPATGDPPAMLMTSEAKGVLSLDVPVRGTPRPTVLLEDLDLRPDISQHESVFGIADRIARACFPGDQVWQAMFNERFGIVPNDLFAFLAETATEVIARIKLNPESKTVQRGGLWYEEAVPAEAIFACPVVASPQGITRIEAQSRSDAGASALFSVIQAGIGAPLQIGGSASVGRGLAMFCLEMES